MVLLGYILCRCRVTYQFVSALQVSVNGNTCSVDYTCCAIEGTFKARCNIAGNTLSGCVCVYLQPWCVLGYMFMQMQSSIPVSALQATMLIATPAVANKDV